MSSDGGSLAVRRIGAADDPRFAAAYAMLWGEFGEKGEVETADVLAERLAWRAAHADRGAGFALHYELLTVEESGRLLAVCDHSVIVACEDPPGRQAREVVVHASHSYVEPVARGRGLTHTLLEERIATARQFYAAVRGADGPAPRITLVAEVEIPGSRWREQVARLAWFEKLGYRRVEPSAIDYAQPDFRSPAAIDASGGPAPLPLWLVIRRVGSEAETAIPRPLLRQYVASLYHMYGRSFRAGDMAPLWAIVDRLDAAPGDPESSVRLLLPTAELGTA